MGVDTAQPTQQCVYIVVHSISEGETLWFKYKICIIKLHIHVKLMPHTWHRSPDEISLFLLSFAHSKTVKGQIKIIVDLKK